MHPSCPEYAWGMQELLVVQHDVLKVLHSRGVSVKRIVSGHLCTALDMHGEG